VRPTGCCASDGSAGLCYGGRVMFQLARRLMHASTRFHGPLTTLSSIRPQSSGHTYDASIAVAGHYRLVASRDMLGLQFLSRASERARGDFDHPRTGAEPQCWWAGFAHRPSKEFCRRVHPEPWNRFVRESRFLSRRCGRRRQGYGVAPRCHIRRCFIGHRNTCVARLD
jgi:hypothetical protein